jgi:ribose 5-phosphate isomerase A
VLIYFSWCTTSAGIRVAIEEWKKAAAKQATKLVKKGMVVGLGSGSTVAHTVRTLAARKPAIICVPSSAAINRLAAGLGLKLGSLDDYSELDLAIDGADEVDPNLNLIKGKGGAHTREKIVASAARKVAIVVDRTKLVTRLGERIPVPVEVIPFAHKFTMQQLAKLGGKPKLRMTSKGTPFVTDDGNYIVDVKFRSISTPAALEQKINRIPGVVENGIFVEVADEVLVGYEGGCVRLRSKRDFLRFMRSFL